MTVEGCKLCRKDNSKQ